MLWQESLLQSGGTKANFCLARCNAIPRRDIDTWHTTARANIVNSRVLRTKGILPWQLPTAQGSRVAISGPVIQFGYPDWNALCRRLAAFLSV